VREYERNLSKVILQGLRKIRRPQEDSLVECYNGVPTETGVKAYERPGQALDGDCGICGCPPNFPIVWPYPMTFVGADANYLAYNDELFLIECNWSVTKIADIDCLRDFADFGDYAVFAGESQVIVKDTEHETYGAILPDDSFPEFHTCCNFNGQLVVGDVTSSWNSATSQSVGWSNIGVADFTMGEGNEAGHMRMPYRGKVLKVKKLGKAVMVYCENGVARIFPHEQTFGLEELMDVGVLNYFSVCGDDREHMFLDTSFNLWRIKEDGKPEKINCQEWFEDMSAGLIIALFDPGKRHFYFSDHQKTFVYGDDRLFEIGILPTSLMNLNYYFTGTWEEADDNDNCGFTASDFVLGIDTVNSRKRSIKTLTLLEADADYEGNMFLSSGYRYKHGEFSARPWTLATDESTARMQMSASDVRCRLKLEDYSETDRVVALTSRWQFPDNRYVRSYSNDNPAAS